MTSFGEILLNLFIWRALIVRAIDRFSYRSFYPFKDADLLHYIRKYVVGAEAGLNF